MATSGSRKKGTRAVPIATTTCPFCGQLLANRSAIEHLRRSKREYEREMAAELDKKLRAAVQAERRTIRQEESERRKKLEAELVWVRGERTDAQRRLKNQRTELEKEFRKRLVETKREQEKALKEKLRDELKALREKLLAEAREKAERDFERRERALGRIVSNQKDEIAKLQRQVERLSAADRGEFTEADLMVALKREFPDDQVERTKRGRAGADILHHVYYEAAGDRRQAGLIVYESKDTARWQTAFLQQAKKAMKTHGTRHVVLVSRAFPRNQKHLAVRDGIVVVHPAHFLHVARVLRGAVIDIDRAGLTARGQVRKTELLYEYLTGDEFRQAFDSLVDVTGNLKELLTGEQRTHESVWAKRDAAYNKIGRTTSAIDGRIRAIIERPASAKGAKVVRIPVAKT